LASRLGRSYIPAPNPGFGRRDGVRSGGGRPIHHGLPAEGRAQIRLAAFGEISSQSADIESLSMPDPINPIGALPTYREALTAPALLAGVDTSAWAPVRPTPNWLGAGLRAGGNELLGLGGAAVEALGRATGADSVARWGNAVAADRMQAAQEAGRPDLERAPWEPGGGSPLPWLGYQVAKQVPALGAMILGGALVPEAAVPAALTRLGAVAPRVLGGGAGLEAGAAAKAGQEFAQHVTGATIAGYPIGVGALTEAAKEGGELTPEKARAALVGGAPWAAVGGLVPTQLRNLATQGTAGSLARRS
jgi:hypothetical protein